jgi:transcriptional regulator with XRE-family HTH domain
MNQEKKNAENTIEDQRIIDIANKIKKLRIQKGYSSHETFAWDNNLNRVQYWRIEKGTNITMKTLLAILDIHKISLSSFFSDIE